MTVFITIEKHYPHVGAAPTGKYVPKLRAQLEGGPSYAGRACGSVAEAQRDAEKLLGRKLDWQAAASDRIRSYAVLEF